MTKREELLNSLRKKITDIENRPHAKQILNGLSGESELVNVQDQDPQSKPKMHWDNLKKDRCPKCGSELTWSSDGRFIVCVVDSFKISVDKFNQYTN
jgi:hypothetical protein